MTATLAALDAEGWGQIVPAEEPLYVESLDRREVSGMFTLFEKKSKPIADSTA